MGQSASLETKERKEIVGRGNHLESSPDRDAFVVTSPEYPQTEEEASTVDSSSSGGDDETCQSDSDESDSDTSSSESSSSCSSSSCSSETDNGDINKAREEEQQQQEEFHVESKSDPPRQVTVDHSSDPTTGAIEASSTPSPQQHHHHPQQQQLALLTLSTPSQWKSTFGTFSEIELTELLVSCCCDSEEEKIVDLSPFCDELLSMAQKIKEYKALEGAITNICTQATKNLDQPTAMDCFYNPHQGDFGNQDESELIGLCERLLAAGRLPKPKKKKKESTPKRPMCLSRVRQKLVPSKMKEHVFWESLWVLLYDHYQRSQTTAFYKRLDLLANEAIQETCSNSQNRRLQGKLRTVWDCVSRLTAQTKAESLKRERSEEMVRKLWIRIQQLEKEPRPLSSEDSYSFCDESHHSGRWIQSKDSQEFLAFPKEVKEALRAEKQKRLAVVREEMKFILDSDKVEDSHGKWSCCETTNYHDPCSKDP